MRILFAGRLWNAGFLLCSFTVDSPTILQGDYREFRKKFAKAVEKARENRKTDDYQLYIRKKWEAMGKESPLWTSEMEQTLPWEQTPDTTADEDILFYSNQSEIDKE